MFARGNDKSFDNHMIRKRGDKNVLVISLRREKVKKFIVMWSEEEAKKKGAVTTWLGEGATKKFQ
jgi:hypothetical protein